MKDLAGKVAVITGGASGIGLATAKALARQGMRLVLADIEQGALDTAAHDLSRSGADVIGVRTDVGELAEVQQLADTTFKHFGAAHVVFNNAGVAVFGPVQDMSHADWEWIMKVDLWGPIHGVEAFLPRMIAQGQGGHIVNTASFAGLVANQGLSVYCVAKYGVVALSECLAKDLREHNIGSSVLCPMVVATNINDSARNRPAEFGGPERDLDVSDEQAEKMRGRVLPVEGVADKVVKAIKNNELYIVTHEESREFVRRRFERIDKSFDL
ncbi:MAG: SDR family NAD(P)-dependent oxidoreductase [Proteobacteria bacterium]|nr:SDR family NAD(P)-dependent oxidoreductase [Pseudomonadota bacterium]